MKNLKILSIFIIIFCWSSKISGNTYPGFDFNNFKETPVSDLAKAVEDQNIFQIEKILKDTSINIDYEEPKYGASLLMLAVANNKTKSVEKLLQSGANPNKLDKFGDQSAIMIACDYYIDNCNTDILKLLIEYGGNVNAVKNIDRKRGEGGGIIGNIHETVLMIAAGRAIPCNERVKVLVEAGADINKCTYYDGYGAITTAIIQDNLDIVRYLVIENKAKIPEYCYRVTDPKSNNVNKFTVSEFLNGEYYTPGSKNYKLREEIISYLDSKGLK